MLAEFLPGNRITLLNSGAEYFPALLSAIEAARSEIFLETYIFADDEIGHEVAGALSRAAARGVQVNVTVDGFGARNFRADFLPRLTPCAQLLLNISAVRMKSRPRIASEATTTVVVVARETPSGVGSAS